MVALSDGRLSCIHSFYRNMTVLSWVNCYLKSVKFLFLLSIFYFEYCLLVTQDTGSDGKQKLIFKSSSLFQAGNGHQNTSSLSRKNVITTHSCVKSVEGS